MPIRRWPAVTIGLTLAAAACSDSAEPTATGPSATPAVQATTTPSADQAPSATTAPDPATTLAAPTTTISPFARPDWLGTRLLPLRDDEYGVAQPTPPELQDRHLETLDLLPPPTGIDYEFTIGPIPAEVLVRSSWSEDCPVAVEELRYLTMSHIGFDGQHHTGEMIVNGAVAEDVVAVFAKLHEARYPIEQMRVITAEEIDAHPTGDWNDTTSFVCRPAVGTNRWSQHAFGLAIDVNPFHNPYLKGDLVLPELATDYTERSVVLDGMIVPGDVVTEAFFEIGWGWGGNWNSLKDWMHFSRSGT